LPRKVEKYYQNRYAFRQEIILLRKITATPGAGKKSSSFLKEVAPPAGSHTIRIVCDTPVIDLDYLTYTTNA